MALSPPRRPAVPGLSGPEPLPKGALLSVTESVWVSSCSTPVTVVQLELLVCGHGATVPVADVDSDFSHCNSQMPSMPRYVSRCIHRHTHTRVDLSHGALRRPNAATELEAPTGRPHSPLSRPRKSQHRPLTVTWGVFSGLRV